MATAYGPKGVADVIPPDATLIFVIEVVDVKAKSLTEVLSKTLTERGLEAMIAEFHSLKEIGILYIGESDINAFGYRLLNRKQVNEAIEVFKRALPQKAKNMLGSGQYHLR